MNEFEGENQDDVFYESSGSAYRNEVVPRSRGEEPKPITSRDIVQMFGGPGRTIPTTKAAPVAETVPDQNKPLTSRDIVQMFGGRREEPVAEPEPKKEPGLAIGDSLAKSWKTAMVTWDLLANKLEKAVTGEEKDTKDILAKSASELAKMESDPRIAELVRIGDKADSTPEAVRDMLWYAVKNPTMIANFLAEQAPAAALGGGIGSVLAAPVRAAAVGTATRLGASQGVAGFIGKGVTGAGLNTGAVVTQSLGSNYVDGLNKYNGDTETASEYAVNKTMAEIPANAIAGAFLGLAPFASKLANIGTQVAIQGTGGALGAYQAAKAVGEEVSRGEMILEFLGEGALAPLDILISRFGNKEKSDEENAEDIKRRMKLPEGRKEIWDALNSDAKIAQVLKDVGLESPADPNFDDAVAKVMDIVRVKEAVEQISPRPKEEVKAESRERQAEVNEAFRDTASTGVGVGVGTPQEGVIRRDSVQVDEQNRQLVPIGEKPDEVLIPNEQGVSTPAVAGEDIVAAQQGYKPLGGNKIGTTPWANRFLNVTQAESNMNLLQLGNELETKLEAHRTTGKVFDKEALSAARTKLNDLRVRFGLERITKWKQPIQPIFPNLMDQEVQVRRGQRSKEAGGGEFFFLESRPLPEGVVKPERVAVKGAPKPEGGTPTPTPAPAPVPGVPGVPEGGSGQPPTPTPTPTPAPATGMKDNYVSGEAVGAPVTFTLNGKPVTVQATAIVGQKGYETLYQRPGAILGLEITGEGVPGGRMKLPEGVRFDGVLTPESVSQFAQRAATEVLSKPNAKPNAKPKAEKAKATSKAKEASNAAQEGKQQQGGEQQREGDAAGREEGGRQDRKREAKKPQARTEDSGSGGAQESGQGSLDLRRVFVDEFETVEELNKKAQSLLDPAKGEVFRAVRVPIGDLVGKIPGLGLIQKSASLFGKEVVFFKVEEGKNIFDGAVIRGGKTIFVNVTSTKPHIRIVGHELVHALRRSNPAAYERLVNSLQPMLDQKGFAGYTKLLKSEGMKTADKILEEAIGDIVGDRFGESEFWQMLADRNPTGFKQFAREVINFIDNILKKIGVNTLGSETLVKDLKAARAEVARILADVGQETQAAGEGIDLSRSRSKKRTGDVVSTRLPTAVKATENAISNLLTIGIDAIRQTPGMLEQHSQVISKYPNLTEKQASGDAESVIKAFVDHVVENLIWLHNKMPAEIRARAKLWYDGANKIAKDFSKEFNLTTAQAAGVLATQSPQKDWFQNVDLARRIGTIYRNQQNFGWTDEMGKKADEKVFLEMTDKKKKILDGIRGKTLSELDDPTLKGAWIRVYDETYNSPSHRIVTPEGGYAGTVMNSNGTETKVAWGSFSTIAKAVSIIEDGSIENISEKLGTAHKVRSFYNNIADPKSKDGHVTIDTHAVAAALLRPLGGSATEVNHALGTSKPGVESPSESAIYGVSGNYGVYADAYRIAAKQLGILPRELQSITWEAVRGLFPETFKKGASAIKIDELWYAYKTGDRSKTDVRNETFKLANGITKPDWVGVSASQVYEGQRDTADAGELSGTRLPGRNTGVGGRARGGTTAGVQAEVAQQTPPEGGVSVSDDISLSRAREPVKESDVEAIARMSQEERDNTYPADLPGGFPAFNLYEARKLLPKPSDKLKRVTANNTFDLHNQQDYIANVDGTHFGVTKQEDPDDADNESAFVYAYERLDLPFGSFKTTITSDVGELFAEMRASLKKDDISLSRVRETLQSEPSVEEAGGTDSAAFKRWFGDSKITDGDGNPDVWYHGTARDIKAFIPKQAGATFVTKAPPFAEGFTSDSEDFMRKEMWSAASPEQRRAWIREATAIAYINGDIDSKWRKKTLDQLKESEAKGVTYDSIDRAPSSVETALLELLNNQLPSRANIIPVYVRAENPFDYENFKHRSSIRRLLAAEFEKAGELGQSQLASLDQIDNNIAKGDWNVIESSDVQNAIRQSGFDSFYVKEGGNKNLAVYNPNQLKSVFNQGTWSTDTDEISLSRARTSIANAVSTASVPGGFAQAVRDRIASAILPNGEQRFNWWHKSVGTQLEKARTNPYFRRVYDLGQKFLDDAAMFAMRAQAAAPTILPNLGNMTLQFWKGGINKADNELLGKMLAEGTLLNGPSPMSGKVWTDAELRSRYNATDEQIKLYREARGAIDQSLDDTTKALMAQLARSGGVPQSVIDPLMEAQLPLSAVRDRLVSALGALPPANKTRSAISGVKKMATETESLKKAGYSPLMRFGEFVVSVENKDGEIEYFSLHETAADALRTRNAVAQQFKGPGFKVSNPGARLNSARFKMFAGLSPSTLEAFFNAVPVTSKAEENLRQEYLQLVVSNRSALARMVQRKGTAGYTLDATRTLASFITSNSRHSSKALNMAEMSRAITEIPAEQGDVANEAVKLQEYVQNPQEGVPGIRGFLFFNFLGGSIAAGLVNMTQPVMMTYPYLSQWGAARAGNAMRKALKDASASLLKKSTGDKELDAALKKAADRGITQPQEMFQLMAAAESGTSSLLGHKFMRVWGLNFSVTEVFNRTVSFSAAFNIGRALSKAELEKAGVKDAFEFAVRSVEDTQGKYNKGNRPNWARETGVLGSVGTLAFTFKQYSIAYLEFLKQLYKNGKNGKKALGITLATLILAAGLSGLPGADDLDDIIDTVGNWMGYPTNSKKWKVKFLTETLGLSPTAANFLLYGVSYFLPMDLQARLGLANLVPGTGLLNPTKENKAREVLDVLGPLGGFAANTADAIEMAAKGNLRGAGLKMAPKAVKDAYMGFEAATTGEFRDEQGRLIQKADATDALVRASGFNPQDAASEGRVQRMIQADIDIVKKKKEELHEKLARAIVDKDPKLKKEVFDDLRRWNSGSPEYRVDINMGAVQQRIKKMIIDRSQRFAQQAPAAMRARVMQELQQEKAARN